MDGLVKACKRAILETIEALRKEGHECVEFDVPSRKALSSRLRHLARLEIQKVARCTETFAALTSSDGYQSARNEIGSDPVVNDFHIQVHLDNDES